MPQILVLALLLVVVAVARNPRGGVVELVIVAMVIVEVAMIRAEVDGVEWMDGWMGC